MEEVQWITRRGVVEHRARTSKQSVRAVFAVRKLVKMPVAQLWTQFPHGLVFGDDRPAGSCEPGAERRTYLTARGQPVAVFRVSMKTLSARDGEWENARPCVPVDPNCVSLMKIPHEAQSKLCGMGSTWPSIAWAILNFLGHGNMAR